MHQLYEPGDLDIVDGLRMLDLGCGDGTTALPAAQLGADVLGVDIAGNLVAAGNARAEELLAQTTLVRPKPQSTSMWTL